MMTAEKWYEYQENYKRYGLDMKPKADKFVAVKREPEITLSERVKTLTTLFLAGLLSVLIIISIAYTAGVTYEINMITKDNKQISGEIDNLNVNIKNATNIRHIEKMAQEELGMIYPSPERFVFLTRHEKPQGDFAMLIKEQAYN